MIKTRRMLNPLTDEMQLSMRRRLAQIKLGRGYPTATAWEDYVTRKGSAEQHGRAQKRRMQWKAQIAAEAHTNGLTYNQFVAGAHEMFGQTDHRVLAQVAKERPSQFAGWCRDIKETM